MSIDIVLEIIMVILLAVTVLYGAYRLFCRWQGDMHFVVRGAAGSRRKARATLPAGAVHFTAQEAAARRLVLVGEIGLCNDGRQQGMVLDCLGRAYVPAEQYPHLRMRVRLTPTDAARTDDYWEAVIVPAKSVLRTRLEITLEATQGTLAEALADFGKADFDVIYQVLGRSDWYYDKTRLTLTREDIRSEWLQREVTR